ncbi:MAG: hypothetical protein ACE5KS_01565 [Woeseiaceae bacterium]
MPEITPIGIVVLAGMLVLGVAIGWIIRAGRCAKEKIAVNAGWQEQLEAQRAEHDRLAEQNKSLMQQISQYQASMKDANMRAKELSDSLKETFERRDELQRRLKEMRSALDVAVAQRDQLKSAAETRGARDQASATAIREKDDKIFRLSRELTTWQSRVPPLVDRFRERDLEAQQLEVELQQARERVAALEGAIGPDHTRIEPVDPNTLADGLNASNDPLDEDVPGRLEDQMSDPDESYYDEAVPAIESPDDSEASAEPGAKFADDYGTEAVVNDSRAGENESDDLKLIKGVGPAIEKTLNDLGIFRFNQIAEMSEYDIDRVAQRLKGFRSRIYREDWVGQARNLQYQKNNDLA